MLRGRQVAGRMVDVVPRPAGAFVGMPGPAAGSVLVGGGAIVGSPWKGRAQPRPRAWEPRLSHVGGPRPAPPATLGEALVSRGTCLAGLTAAGRPRDAGPALLSCHLSVFGVEATGGPRTARPPPSDTEGLDLFLRQSCILILDVSPEAYFS